MLSVLRSLGLALPLAWLGDTLAGLQGLLAGLVAASVFSALLGVRWMRSYLWPLGEKPPGAGSPMTAEGLGRWLDETGAWSGLAARVPTILALDGVKAYRVERGRVGLHVGARELVHLHASGVLDLPLPVEIGENLARLSVVERHPAHEHDGWYRHSVRRLEDTETVVWLVGLSHLLYALSQRGAADPITQEEMAAYTRTPQCVAAMTAAAARWETLAA